MKVKVTVPATSANLGPGFDTMGLALNWKYEYTIATTRKENQQDVKSKMVQKGFNSIYKLYEQRHEQQFHSKRVLYQYQCLQP